jgi:ABC-2 type transport system ATP-binding protein
MDNVLTWDPRGFGGSGGRAEVDSPQFEGRGVSAMISWLARQREALLDRRGDPRVGMAGGSSGGGIQLVAAARNHRLVDQHGHSYSARVYPPRPGELATGRREG